GGNQVSFQVGGWVVLESIRASLWARLVAESSRRCRPRRSCLLLLLSSGLLLFFLWLRLLLSLLSRPAPSMGFVVGPCLSKRTGHTQTHTPADGSGNWGVVAVSTKSCRRFSGSFCGCLLGSVEVTAIAFPLDEGAACDGPGGGGGICRRHRCL
ncbi:unnamed protein product, partial [Scytosiphon promiscuus]